ncbi:MAG: aminoacyl-tRNA hydrolase [Bacteroidota bacterium]|nr:aminoacyl-tRNA hydrolase [Candidatus Kapabacteria bacterium]MDW8074260.1 aminoacyl-tRNA hydrolase [Bacteroidota bacterium]
MSTDWIILGLGNPGEKYAYTRHNIGYRVATAFAEKHGATFHPGRGPWLEAQLRYARQQFIVALPTTYMNRSGIAARALIGQYGVQPERLIAIVDEYNFPVGRIHLKLGGSDGGHNGIASLIAELGTEQFWRLRCGIGRSFGQGELVDYVLSPFPPNEQELVEQMISNAVTALEHIAKAGIARAASEINALSKQQAKGDNLPP